MQRVVVLLVAGILATVFTGLGYFGSFSSSLFDLPSVVRSEADTRVLFRRDIEERDRATRSWQSWNGASLEGGDIEGYSPVGHDVDLETCRTMCDTVVHCASIVWDCRQICHLKNSSATRNLEDGRDCTWVLSKAVPTDVASDEKTLQRYDVHSFIQPVRVLASVIVVISRCRESMPWLDAIIRSIKNALNLEVQVIVYERCVEPQESSTTVQGFPMSRQAVPLIFTSTLCIIAHLLANFKTFVDRGVAYLVFLDEGLSSRSARRLHDPSSWIRWDLGSFADTLMHVARLTGIHLVEARDSAEALPRLLDQLAKTAKQMLNWQRPASGQAPGLSRCRHQSTSAPLEGSRRAVAMFFGDIADSIKIKVLLAGLQQVGCKSDIVVGTLAPLFLQAQDLWAAFPHIKVLEWGAPQDPLRASLSVGEESLLHVLQMVKYDLVLLLDLNVFPVQNPDILFLDRASRASSASPVVGAPDWGSHHAPPSDQIDEGVLLVRPSRHVYECAVNKLRKSRLAATEGTWLRTFFGGRAAVLPHWFNALESSKKLYPHIWDERRVVLQHFTRPHRSWSSPEYNRLWRDSEIRRQLLATGRGVADEDDDYAALVAPWRKTFFQLVKLEEHLSLIGLYHDSESYEALRRRIKTRSEVYQEPDLVIPLSLGEPLAPNGLATQQAIPELKSNPGERQALSEFAGLLAMSMARWYKKPWIGFTTGSEDRKGDWREGVAIDWVMAEQVIRNGHEQRVLAFWYGIFAGDYWALMDEHHPGMKDVIKQVLTVMGEDVATLDMPRNHWWPFGNYIMMPYDLLREYAIFAARFVSNFHGTYPFKCPFSTMETRTQSFALRCVGYATERLIHIWSVMKGIAFHYIVDDPESRYLAGCRANQVHCHLS